MKKTLKVMLASTLAISMLSLISCGGGSGAAADGTYNLIFAHVASADHSFNVGALAFKEAVETNSDGRITVSVHPNGELGGNEDELVQKMATGTVDIIIAAPSFMAQSVPEIDLYSVPYLFESIEHWEAVVDGEPGQYMGELVEQKTNFKMLGYYKDGVRNVYTVKPINQPSDIQGIKFRIQNSPVQNTFWSTLGVQPSFVAFNEIYQALQNGVIDGAENSLTSMAQQKHYEVCKYITLSEHDVATRLLIMDDATFQSMPADLQEIVLEAAASSITAHRAADIELEAGYIAEIEAAGGIISEIDKTEWIEATEDVRTEAAASLGLTDILNQINDLKN